MKAGVSHGAVARLAHFLAVGLATESAALILFLQKETLPYPAAILAIFLCYGALGWISFSSRQAISAYVADMELAERVLVGVLAVIIFLVPSALLRKWSPTWGSIALLGALVATLARRSSFLTLFVFSGLLHALTLPALRDATATAFAVLFWVLGVLHLAALHVAQAPPEVEASHSLTPFTVFRNAARPLFAGGVVLGLGLLLWPWHPHQVLAVAKSGPTEIRQVWFDAEVETFSTVMFRAVSLALAVVCVIFLYWLHGRWRRQRAALEDEEELLLEGMAIHVEEGARRVRRTRPRTARGQLMAYLERFIERLAAQGFVRKEGQTVAEYLSFLVAENVLSEATASELRRAVERARYENTRLNKEDVRRFLELLKAAAIELERRREADTSH